MKLKLLFLLPFFFIINSCKKEDSSYQSSIIGKWYKKQLTVTYYKNHLKTNSITNKYADSTLYYKFISDSTGILSDSFLGVVNFKYERNGHTIFISGQTPDGYFTFFFGYRITKLTAHNLNIREEITAVNDSTLAVDKTVVDSYYSR